MDCIDWWCRQSPYTKMLAAVAYSILSDLKILPDFLLIPHYFPVRNFFPMTLFEYDVTVIASAIAAGIIVSLYLRSVIRIWDKKSYFKVLACLYAGVLFYLYYLYIIRHSPPPGIVEEIFWVIICGLSVTICGLVIEYICKLPCKWFCPEKRYITLAGIRYPISGGSERGHAKAGRNMKKASNTLENGSKFIQSNENSVNQYDESQEPEEKALVQGL